MSIIMAADDPRHGSPAGYQAHLREGEPACEPCDLARYRTRKQVNIERLRGERFTYEADEVREVLTPWLTLGLALSAVTVAANLCSQSSGRLFAVMRGEQPWVRRSTYTALAAVTEDDFSPYAKVYADLTRMRIGSLMAAGHELNSIPIRKSGHWRTTSHVSVGAARTIREHYRANEFTVGSNAHTRSRAINAGHRPPLAWDDPYTLAWPDDRRPADESWQYAPADRREVLVDLDHRNAGISEACSVLNLRRDSLEKWCERHNLSDLYSRMVRREQPNYEALTTGWMAS